MIITLIGQDSHAFLKNPSDKICVIGGVCFEGVPGLEADSDGDVVLHAICNAISSITHVYVLGEIAPRMCKEDGVTDSREFLQVALGSLDHKKIRFVSLTIEGARPRMQSKVREIRHSVAGLLGIEEKYVGLTVTSGDGLTSFGQGDGLQCFALVSIEM